MKIALALICKPDKEEAKLLDRCLKSVSGVVDGIFITQAGHSPSPDVSKVIKKHRGHESFYQWDNHFANARSYNFSQVPKDYDYIFWLDADDVIRGEGLREVIEKNQDVDAFSLFYLYWFDEWNNPTVVHHKTRIVRNDGCVEWSGYLHEDFKENRGLVRKHIEGVEVLHLTDQKRAEESMKRNLEIAEEQGDLNDPRTYWNLGNARKAAGLFEESLSAFDNFLALSRSDEEKYIARLRRAESWWGMNDKEKAIDELRYAIGLRPDYPDAYISLGQYLYHAERYAEAVKMLKIGLIKPQPIFEIIVFNPRDYDLTPLRWLAYSYVALKQPILALECFKSMLEITPRDKKLQKVVETMQGEADRYEELLEHVKRLREIKDKEVLRKELDALPDDFKSHPVVCQIRNVNFIKETSSRKDIVYFCGFTEKEWTPLTAETEGIGGSEEAVIHLTKRWAAMGYNVTVYNNCGHKEQTFDGVTYKPFYAWNYRDKQDVVILWRHPKMADYDINAKTVLLDVHDMIPAGEINERRLQKIDKVFVKSRFHRTVYSNVPDEKVVVVPNGIVPELFTSDKKDPHLVINTSSPDRSLSALLDCWPEIKRRVPEAKLKWAYGWGVFDIVHGKSPDVMKWKDEIVHQLKTLSGVEDLGKISHGEVAKLYNEAAVLAYPSEFAEIDCISLSKAMAAGAYPVTTDFAAMGDKQGHGGTFLPSPKTKDSWCKPYQHDFAMEGGREAFIEAVVDALVAPKNTKEMEVWAKATFDWDGVVNNWISHF